MIYFKSHRIQELRRSGKVVKDHTDLGTVVHHFRLSQVASQLRRSYGVYKLKYMSQTSVHIYTEHWASDL